LAYATREGSVALRNQEGVELDFSPLERTGAFVTALTWHPYDPSFLVVAWKTKSPVPSSALSASPKTAIKKKSLSASRGRDNAVLQWYKVREGFLDISGLRETWLPVGCGGVTVLTWDKTGDALFAGTENGKCLVYTRRGPGNSLAGLDQGRALPLEAPCEVTHAIWKPTGTGPAKRNREPRIPDVFIVTSNGDIYVAQPRWKKGTSLVASLGAGVRVRGLFLDTKAHHLVALDQNVLLRKFVISPDMELRQSFQVKLSVRGSGETLEVADLGGGVLAAVNRGNSVKVWDIDRDENYSLPLADPRHMALPNDTLNCLSYCAREGLLFGGTAQGRVCIWRFDGNKDVATRATTENDWQVLPPVNLGMELGQLAWGKTKSHPGGNFLLAACSTEQVHILQETRLQCRFNMKCSVVQTNPTRLIVQANGKLKKAVANFPIRGLDLVENAILVWSATGTKAEVLEIEKSGPVKDRGVWDCASTTMCLVKNAGATSVACLDPGRAVSSSPDKRNPQGPKRRLNIHNLQGTVKKVVPLTNPTETLPIALRAHGHFLVMQAQNGAVSMWDLKRREPRTLLPARKFDECPPLISEVKPNVDGTKLCFCAGDKDLENEGETIGSSKVYVYDVERDRVDTLDFSTRKVVVRAAYWDTKDPRVLAIALESDCESLEARAEAAKKKAERKEAGSQRDKSTEETQEKNVTRRTSVSFGGIHKIAKRDDEERPDQQGGESEAGSGPTREDEIAVVFATPDSGLLVQDWFVAPSRLIGVFVPNLVLAPAAAKDSTNVAPRVVNQRMRDFQGIGDVDEATKGNLLNFSFHLAAGNLDEAYRSVTSIRSENIWENMARMCVKTGRLDVAEICISHMQSSVQVSRALRQAKQDGLPKECQIAAVAVQLGMVREAEHIYRDGKHWKRLAKLLQGQGRWREALQICEQHQRIHLKALHYEYGQHFEARGNVEEAMSHYQKAAKHIQIPRLLLKMGKAERLLKMVKSSSEPTVVRWWAQHCEACGHLSEAIKYYGRVKDNLAVVRIHCRQKNFEEASKIALNNGPEVMLPGIVDPGASFHLAKQLEAAGQLEEAIKFYKLSNRYKHAARVARQELQNDDLLMRIALEAPEDARSSQTVLREAGRHFEEVGEFGKAVTLYTKAGETARAISICFKHDGLFEELKTLSLQLANKPDTDPALLRRCAELFLEHRQFGKAAELFVAGKQYEEALELIREHRVTLTGEMADKLTPPKGKTKADRQHRTKVLMEIAVCLRKQKSHHLACKKFTQAGDRVRAIECLIKERATDKVIYYASKTKRKELYILAANYLQNLDWHSNPNVMKSIINFYTLAKAHEQLAYFYDACAQIEIDEYRDYEKALTALKEAMKYLLKANGGQQGPSSDAIDAMDQRISIVERFVEARHKIKTDPESVQTLDDLVDAPNVEASIRVGDVFALLIEFAMSREDFGRAYECIEKMQSRGIPLGPYLDRVVVERVYQSMGIPLTEIDGDGGEDEVLDEEIEEEEDEEIPEESDD